MAIRKFEPGTKQEERFNLAREAVVSHRERIKQEATDIQIESSDKFRSTASSARDRLRQYINRENTLLSDLTKTQKFEHMFPGYSAKKNVRTQAIIDQAKFYAEALSANVTSSPTEFWTKVKQSGLSPRDWIDREVTSKTPIPPPEPLKVPIPSRQVQTPTKPILEPTKPLPDIAKAAPSVTKARPSIKASSNKSPAITKYPFPEIHGPGIETHRVGITGREGSSKWSNWMVDGLLPEGSARWTLQKSVTAESVKEYQEQYNYIKSRNLLNVYNVAPKYPKIAQWGSFHLDEPGFESVIDITNPAGREELRQLELRMATSLGDDDAVKSIQEDMMARAARDRMAATRENQEFGNKRAVNPPIKRTMKNAARKVVDSIRVKKAQKVAEFELPAKLNDYVSQGVKEVQELNSFGPLRRIAPYAMGIGIGADILSSRDKTGPLWGAVAGTLAWAISRGRVSKNTSALIGSATYVGVRSAVGLTRRSLEANHNGSLDGFGELGFSPAMRHAHTSFGSGWKGVLKGAEAFIKTDAGKAIGGAIGLGIAIGAATGDFGTGYNAGMSAIGGAALGYLKGGGRGAAIGAVAGGLGGTVVNKAAEAIGGSAGEAFVGGVTTSVAASLTMSGLLRGGLFYKSLKNSMSKMGVTDELFEEGFKAAGIKNPLGPTGLAVNASDALRTMSAGNTEVPISPTVKKVLGGISGYLDKHSTVTKYFDAAFGSPKLIEAVEKVGGAENLNMGHIAKAIGADILEGAPIGLGMAAISLPFSYFGGDGSSHDVNHSPSISGLGETGEAAIGRKQLTDFGSGFQGNSKTAKAAAKTLGEKIKNAAGTIAKKISPKAKLEKVAGKVLDPKAYEAQVAQLIEEGKYEPVLSSKQGQLRKTKKVVRGFETYNVDLGSKRIPIRGHDDIVDELKRITDKNYAFGEVQKRTQQTMRDKGIFEKLLPTVQQEPYEYKGVRYKANPVMEFSKVDINQAVLDYAREKGIKVNADYWQSPIAQSARGRELTAVNTAASDSVFMAVNKTHPSVNLSTMAGKKLLPKSFATGAGTPESIRAKAIASGSGTLGLKNDQLDLNRTLNNKGSRPRSINEAIQGEGAPSPVFHKPVDPTRGTLDLVSGAKGKTHIASGGATLSEGRVKKSVNKFNRDYSDFAYSNPYGMLMRRGHPKVLEGFQAVGVSESLRLKNTDFGTGWDPARRLGKALFGQAAREGIEEVARGAAFKEILRSNEFQEALAKGTVVKKLGEGGVGSVQLMETTIGGKKFKYARKQVEGMGEYSAEKILEGETSALRAIQGSIGPTPYGKGVIAHEGRDVPVMYFEAIQDAVTADVAIAQQGGFTHKQVSDLLIAVEELHEKGFVHSDIKAANILINKEGRVSLIDPFPDRYKVSGWGAFADDDTLNRLSRSQDQVAVERIAAGGDPRDMEKDLGLISNSLVLTTWHKSAVDNQYGSGVWDELSPWAREIHRQAKTEPLHKMFREKIGASPFSNRPMPEIDYLGFEEMPSEELAARRRKMAMIDAQKAKAVAKREQIHEAAIKNAAQNNSQSSRRHTGNSQQQSMEEMLAQSQAVGSEPKKGF